MCDFANSNFEQAIFNADNDTFDCNSEKFKNMFFNSNIIPNSRMFNEINVHTKSRSKPTLLYRGSRDGFKASKFHELCDNKGPTLTIIQSDFGHIFGGFTMQSWANTGVEYVSDTSAFIFKIFQKVTSNGMVYIFNKFNIKPGQHRFAISAKASYLPIFGGGNDFCIADNCNENLNSYSKFGHTYYLPDTGNYSSKSISKYLAGSANFRVLEIEVFQITQ